MWWTHQKVVSVTPRAGKPLCAPNPNPQYQHNYGAGYSINYVPADWHSYRFKHILQFVTLPQRKTALTCTCGHTVVGPARKGNLPFLFYELWRRHAATEQELATTFETLNAALPAPQERSSRW